MTKKKLLEHTLHLENYGKTIKGKILKVNWGIYRDYNKKLVKVHRSSVDYLHCCVFEKQRCLFEKEKKLCNGDLDWGSDWKEYRDIPSRYITHEAVQWARKKAFFALRLSKDFLLTSRYGPAIWDDSFEKGVYALCIFGDKELDNEVINYTFPNRKTAKRILNLINSI